MGKFIINDNVFFIPDENKLIPVDRKVPEVILNAPVSRFLSLLLKKNGEVAPQEEILREVWEKHGQYVTINTLYQNVSQLRKGLKKAGVITSPVRTHPKSGFSFRGDVQAIENEDVAETETIVSRSFTDSDTVARIQEEASPYFEQGMPEDTNKTVDNSVQLYGRKRKKIAYLIIMLMLATINIILKAMVYSSGTTFTVEHSLVGRVDKCALYVDRGNSKSELAPIISYLQKQGVTCNKEEFLYLTKIHYNEDLLLFTCSPGDDKELLCVTSRRIPVYLYSK